MNVVGVILGGGKGSRLLPLTRDRAKPAVPVAGKYRLVDVSISNCIHSDIRSIFLLTQFNSVSLHQHIQSSYPFHLFDKNFIRILAAQQTPDSGAWYQGTADAVRKTFRYFVDEKPDLIVVLSGDQLYRMDFMDVIKQHEEKRADVTICTQPVNRSDAKSLGIMQVDEDRKIIDFKEKPGDDSVLDGLQAPMCDDEKYLASMGIYIFNIRALSELLNDETKNDFGRHIIPSSIETCNVFSYIFEGYWKDIGAIRGFWEANLSLTEPMPPFNFYHSKNPIYTRTRYLSPSKINQCILEQCLLSEGCIISATQIKHSVVSIRAVVGEGSVVEDSVIMGADYYQEETKVEMVPPIGIGRGCTIKNAIIDKNACIGDGSYISPEDKPNNTVTDLYTIRDGVIVIPKNAVIPAGTRV
ncbi:MAG: glucose-1-phosphate adenylyltransferase [Kiritimatiellae bacterium]|nr:glucose-1-phosphate adenylyltransferase [Kiritimatiellia bacterium]